MLPEDFKEPEDFKWGHFENAEGMEIRYGSVKPKSASKGTIVLLTGFREPVEKYFELTRELLGKGFTVWTMDWVGQGGSERFFKRTPEKMHSEGYDEQIETLRQFMDDIVKRPKQPLILMAHSMGGHIALRYLKECDNKVDSAVLTAPMFNVSTGYMPRSIARRILKFAKAANYLENYIGGSEKWTKDEAVFKYNQKTSNLKKFKQILALFKEKPELRMEGPTYGWVHHTFESVKVLNQEDYLKSIKTPILMQMSGKDSVVDEKALRAAGHLLPNCTRVDVNDAKHEIWMERKALRDQWMEHVDVFLKNRLHLRRTPSPKKLKQKGDRNPKLG